VNYIPHEYDDDVEMENKKLIEAKKEDYTIFVD
jgi:hypothetical protein